MAGHIRHVCFRLLGRHCLSPSEGAISHQPYQKNGQSPPARIPAGKGIHHASRVYLDRINYVPHSSNGHISQGPSPVALRPKVSLALVAACSLAAVIPRVATAQHITIDGRFSPAQTLVGPNYSIGASLGKQVGSNLFHSFGQFSLATPESATFSGPAAISNVIGRVTGGNGSKIDGKIQSSIAGANLYLINPSGIVFGPNATVNVSGSFHASTADYLRLSDGAKFQATNPDGSTLSAAPPAAFGFLTAQPAALSVGGSTLTLGAAPRTLGLVGGPVSITSSKVAAPAGTIHVASVASTGEVPIDPRNTPALTVTSFGPVDITKGSKLGVSDPRNLRSGGSVFIRSGALTIDASEINADNYGSGPGGMLSLRGENQITLSNGANVHAVAMGSSSGADVLLSTVPSGVISADASTVLTGSLGPGNGGALSIETGRLTLTNGAGFTSSAEGSGNGGPIKISANSVLLDGGATLDQSTGIFSITSDVGRGGSIAIIAGVLALHNGANVLAASCATPSCNGPVAGAVAGAGGELAVSVGGALTVDSGASLGTMAEATGAAGNVSVMVAGPITIDMSIGALPSILDGIGSLTQGAGNAGKVAVGAGTLSIANNGEILSSTFASGDAGNVSVSAGTLTIASSGAIGASTFASGKAGGVTVAVSGELTIDGSGGNPAAGATGIFSQANPNSSGAAGTVSVSAKTLSIANSGEIANSSFASGNPAGSGQIIVTAEMLSIASNGAIVSNTSGAAKAGSVSVNVAGQLTIDGTAANTNKLTGIGSDVEESGIGDAGKVTVNAGILSILSNGSISSNTFGAGKAGSISVNVPGRLTIDGTAANTNKLTGIASDAEEGRTGDAGNVIVNAGILTILSNGSISSNTFGEGKAGSVSVNIAGQLTIDGTAANTNKLTGIASDAEEIRTGDSGNVTVNAGTLSILSNGQISSDTFGVGKAGSVTVAVSGQLTIVDSGGILSQALRESSGSAGNVSVGAGTLVIASSGVIAASTFASGNAGSVTVAVSGQLTIDGSGGNPAAGATGIFSQANPKSSGAAGTVSVSAGTLSIVKSGEIATSTFASGNAGSVTVAASGRLAIDGSGENLAVGATGVFSQTESSGGAGTVAVSAGTLVITNDGVISSRTLGFGNGGSVLVAAGNLAIAADGRIATDTLGRGSGNAGGVSVNIAGPLTIDGLSQTSFTGISSRSTQGSGGNAGDVKVSAGGLSIGNGGAISTSTGGSGTGGTVAVAVIGDAALSGGALITSAAAGAGNGGTVDVTAQGPLSLSDPGTGIIASAASTASGNAGSVIVAAPRIAVTSGAEIASTTAGTGAGGSVTVTTPGALVLDGNGDSNTEIAASAVGPQSGPGGSVTVAANRLTVGGRAQIASSTAGPGKGGDVNVTVGSDIVLPDPGPQITAQSTGSGDAGSITISAVRLLMNDGAKISTEAEASTASGGNITLHVRDFLYLVSSEISTSVKGETGNGGNIAIDPQLVILNHSSIIAQAIEGHGGNITITAGQFIPSSDSIVSASSQLGISGTVVINGPRVDVNGALVVLSSELRGRTEVLRESCAAQGSRPQSSLVEAGRGGLPQDAEATLPALYIAGRDLVPNPQAGSESTEASGALRTTVHLTMRCG
jgi:filamentous hemagglutinin family protein